MEAGFVFAVASRTSWPKHTLQHLMNILTEFKFLRFARQNFRHADYTMKIFAVAFQLFPHCSTEAMPLLQFCLLLSGLRPFQSILFSALSQHLLGLLILKKC